MIGITLNSDQIRTAPLDVRRWIEREVMTSLGLQAGAIAAEKHESAHLAACTEEIAAGILEQIEGVLPAVNVFFEFGRQGAVVGEVEMFRLLDIAHHARLQNIGQVIACLGVINQAFGRVAADKTATFCGFDRDGHCFVTLQTQQSILRLWQTVIAGQQLATDPPETPAGAAIPDAPNAAAGSPAAP